MGTYVSSSTLKQFITSAKYIDRGLANGVTCSQKLIKVRGVDTDSFHRHHRIMAKLGYLYKAEKNGENVFTLSPKGLALLDLVKMI